MKATLSQSAGPRPGGPSLAAPSAVFGLFGLFGAGFIGLVSGVLVGWQGSGPSIGAVVAIYLVIVLGCAVALHSSYPHGRVGLCNLVTLARLMILGVLGVAMLEGLAPNATVLGLAILSLSLDGVDGWLARRQRLASDFGARFDVEVDAGFALLLALYAASSDGAGPYVILLGLPHYLFWIARSLWPWLNAPLPPSLGRKAVCVLQIATLIAFLVPQLGGPVRDGAVLAAVTALLWSFGRDILWLHRTRP